MCADSSPDKNQGGGLETDRIERNQVVANNSAEYQSSEMLVQIAMNEYSIENERAQSLETRAGIIMGGLIAIISFAISYIPMENILAIMQTSGDGELRMILSYTYLAVTIAAILTAIMALVALVRTLSIRTYCRINYEDIRRKGNNLAAKNLIAFELIKQYAACIENNQKTNTKKAAALNAGLTFGVISICIFMLTFILGSLIQYV